LRLDKKKIRITYQSGRAENGIKKKKKMEEESKKKLNEIKDKKLDKK
jgi:hypothetical protein